MITSFQSFLDICDKIAFSNNFKSDWFGILGLGYHKDLLVQKKIYFNFEKNINIDTFPFLTKKELYLSYVPYLDSARVAYNSIAIKQNLVTNTFTNYFHLKLNNSFIFKYSDNIIGINLKDVQKGVSVEFNEIKTDVKRYYYIFNKNQVKAILALFKISLPVEVINFIEYTHNPKKIIIILNNINKKDILEFLKPNVSKSIYENTVTLSKNFNLTPCVFGKYLVGNKCAVYWDIYYNNFNVTEIIL